MGVTTTAKIKLEAQQEQHKSACVHSKPVRILHQAFSGIICPRNNGLSDSNCRRTYLIIGLRLADEKTNGKIKWKWTDRRTTDR